MNQNFTSSRKYIYTVTSLFSTVLHYNLDIGFSGVVLYIFICYDIYGTVNLMVPNKNTNNYVE